MERNIWIEGISLRCRRVGEFHKSVVLLDRRGGIREAILHGAYRGKNRLSASTEPFKRLKLLLYHNPVKNSWKITDGELLGGFSRLGGEVFRIYLASLWSELIIKTQGGGAVGEEGEELFFLFGRSLGALTAAPSSRASAVNVQFLWRFLKFMGCEAGYSVCSSCASSLQKGAVYDGRQHQFLCLLCASPGCEGLPGEAMNYLGYTLALPLKESLRVRLSDRLLQKLEGIPLAFLRSEGNLFLKTPSYRNFL